jgi:two-component system response regulator
MDDRRAEILLVEDDDNDVAVALRALSRQALDGRVRVMRDGAELLDYLFAEPAPTAPKAILLDLKMPRLDGRSALREIRSRPATRHIPVVIVSSSERESDVRECYELGANSFIVKEPNPWNPGAYLVETVRYWLDRNEVTGARPATWMGRS